jgi:hypothetical protein
LCLVIVEPADINQQHIQEDGACWLMGRGRHLTISGRG